MRSLSVFLFATLGSVCTSKGQHCDSLIAPKVECRSYYQGNKLQSIMRFKNGERHGHWVFLRSDGNYERRIRYRKGVRIWELFYENGKVVRSIDRKGREKKRKDCGCH